MVSVDVLEFEEDLKRVLALLANRNENEKWISSLDISNSLLHKYGISLHWRTIEALLKKNSELVARKKKNKRWHYLILNKGEELLKHPYSTISLVNPLSAVKEIVKLHDYLSSLSGQIKICDPYLDYKTIEHLDSCPINSEISLLTKNVNESGKLNRIFSTFARKITAMSIRKANLDPLHDRYIIDGSSMVIIGTSLNGFGNKNCFVTPVGKDIRKITLQEFDKMWSRSQPWP